MCKQHFHTEGNIFSSFYTLKLPQMETNSCWIKNADFKNQFQIKVWSTTGIGTWTIKKQQEAKIEGSVR